MSAFVQALLMDDLAAVMPGVPTCIADAYYSCGPTNDPYWANVVLLLHGNGADGGTTFTDSSSFAKVPSSTSGCSTSTTSPKFGTAAINSTSASAAVTYASSTDFNLPLEYTLEFWIYLSALPGADVYIAGSSVSRYLVITSTGQLSTIGWNGTGFGTCTLTAGVWQHYAQTRDAAGTNRNFLNGVQLGSGTSSTTALGASPFQLLGIPARPDLASVQGKIDDFRWTQGICRYNGPFSIPTAAFPDALESTWDPADPRTVLSLHADSIADSSCYQPKTVTLTGTASVSTAEKKFGTSSFLVPNTGSNTLNGVVVTDHQDFDFGTGDFCFDCWAYRSVNTYTGTLFYYTDGTAPISFTVNTSGIVIMNYRSSGGTQASISTGVTFPLTTWQYVVVQRRGTNWEMYLHGAAPYTTAITGGAGSTVNSAADLFIGRTNASSALGWNGYIDEFRVTKGAARYTASFTPPTLLNCDSTAATVTNSTSGTEALTGIAATAEQGALVNPDGAITLTGVSATASAGTTTGGDSNVSLALTGSAATAAAGTSTIPTYPDFFRLPVPSTFNAVVESVPHATGRRATVKLYLNADWSVSVATTVGGVDTFEVPGYWLQNAGGAAYTPAEVNNAFALETVPRTVTAYGVKSVTAVQSMANGVDMQAGGYWEIDITGAYSPVASVFEKYIIVSPKTNNPRFGESNYYGIFYFTMTIFDTI